MLKQILISSILACLATFSSLSAQQAQLGVTVVPDEAGPKIESVLPQSAASILGLLPGDILLSIDGLELSSPDDLVRVIRRSLPGQIVQLKVQRAGSSFEMLGILARAPGADAHPGWERLQEDLPIAFQDGITELKEVFPDDLPESLRRQLERGQNQMRQFRGMNWPEMPSFSELDFPEMGSWFSLGPDSLHAPKGTQIEVQLTYPESTPEESRDAIIAQAVEQYGPDVQVEFKGQITMTRMQMRSSSEQRAEKPAEGPNRLERMRLLVEEQVEKLKQELAELEAWLDK